MYRHKVSVYYIYTQKSLTAPHFCMKLLFTQMLLFAASTNLSYRIFTYANEKFVFVRVFLKLDSTGPHFYKSSYRLKSCHATASLILCCLR